MSDISLAVAARGRAVLDDPRVNRDLAFTHEERAALGIDGLLPAAVQSLEEQVSVARAQVLSHDEPLERYVTLASIEERNQTLYYRLLHDHIEEMMPIVYTPTVGAACQRWSRIPRRPRGMWITPQHRGRIREVLANAPPKVRLVVATDNERILGLGDLGAGGAGIPVGKLALYVVAAGISPHEVLPISIDVGTDNTELLEDASYVGHRARRLRGPAYESLVEELVDALVERYPGVLLQWEDFKKQNAIDVLERHRSRVLSFNDDIEGTAAVALAGILGAARKSGIPLRDQRVLIVGAGTAGLGIGRLVRRELAAAGLRGDELVRSVAVLDSQGLLVESRPSRDTYKAELAWPTALAREKGVEQHGLSIADYVRKLRPTALVGTTGQPRIFDELVVRAMVEVCELPVIFPLSNPTSTSEADPADVVRWAKGRVLVATGSPFPDVRHEGRLHRVAQGNNVWIFPGVGKGALVSGARTVSEGMFLGAAHALADSLTEQELSEQALYPRLTRLREVTANVALRVAHLAVAEGLAPPASDDALRARIAADTWEPRYAKLVAES